MKLIEGLKQLKDLQRKSSDLRKLVQEHCAITSLEAQKYPNQTKQVAEWIQAHSDILREILRLRVAIQRTNLAVEISIDLNGKQVTKTIAEWIHRRRDLAGEDLAMWNKLTDRGIQEGIVKSPSGDPMEIKIQRFYDPLERDRKKDFYSSEPLLIDSRLEITNAITDLQE